MRALQKNCSETEREFKFSFDEDEIIYESKRSFQKFKWNLIFNYEENNGDLYLYITGREAFDIISETVIGPDKFQKFKRLTEKNVNKRKV